jgi:ribonuclease T1
MSAGRWLAALALGLAVLALPAWSQKAQPPAVGEIASTQLPREAHETIALIRKRGPFPYARDGAVFGNREGNLPKQKRGYYREYTVKTPGERTRGARRIVAGSGGELYYTEDHYNHFRRVRD